MDHFDKLTVEYFNSQPSGAYTSVERHKRSGFVEHVSAFQPVLMLDLGCGQGAFASLVKQYSPATKVICMDISPGMLIHAPEAFPRVVGSALAPPILSESVEMVHVQGLLHHLVGPTRAASRQFASQALFQATRILKPGGHLLLGDVYYEPGWIGGTIFWIKRGLTWIFGNQRLRGFGAPVTSFYTRSQLQKLLQVQCLEIESIRLYPWTTKKSKSWGILPIIAKKLFRLQWGDIWIIARKQ